MYLSPLKKNLWSSIIVRSEKSFAMSQEYKSKRSFEKWTTSRLVQGGEVVQKELCRQNVYTLTLPQSRKSRDRLPSIPPILPRQLVSRRGLSSAQPERGPKARLDHSGDFGPTPKWRLYRSSWTARSSSQVQQDAQHRCQCRHHCRWLANWPRGQWHLPWNFPISRTSGKFAEKWLREILREKFIRKFGDFCIISTAECDNEYWKLLLRWDLLCKICTHIY